MEADRDLVNWFCHHCGEHIYARRGEDPRRCPTYGCRRPDGFGRYARIRRS